MTEERVERTARHRGGTIGRVDPPLSHGSLPAPDPGLRPATADDAPALLAIVNHVILTSTALYEDQPRSLARQARWLEEKAGAGLPVLLAEVDGTVAGFASYGPFRPHPGYRHTVEHSLYVGPQWRRRGIGRRLLGGIIAAGEAAGLHAIVGAIDADNKPSLALHAEFGFTQRGHLPEVARKFGRWLDLLLVHRLLRAGEPA